MKRRINKNTPALQIIRRELISGALEDGKVKIDGATVVNFKAPVN